MPRDLLPLFPLPVVLFPGATLPLHIFEPRYRRMLADCLASDSRFGLIRLPGGVDEPALPVDTVGCVAEITSVESLPDGRSDILVRGVSRFVFLGWSDAADHPYRVGSTAPYDDEPEQPSALAQVAESVRDDFLRAARATRQLSGERGSIPELPRDPAALSFIVAAMIDLGLEARQRLLASRSALVRLTEIEDVLARAAPALVARAEVHERAKSNGHGPHATL